MTTKIDPTTAAGTLQLMQLIADYLATHRIPQVTCVSVMGWADPGTEAAHIHLDAAACASLPSGAVLEVGRNGDRYATYTHRASPHLRAFCLVPLAASLAAGHDEGDTVPAAAVPLEAYQMQQQADRLASQAATGGA